MTNLNERLVEFIGGCTSLDDLTYKNIALNCSCSQDQVRRRVCGEVKSRKDEIKKIEPANKNGNKGRVGSVGNDLELILKRIEKIEVNIELIKKELSSKDKPNPWLENLPCNTPKDQLVDIKVNGSIRTMEYEETYNYVCYSEFIDREINKIESQADRGWITDDQCDEEIKELKSSPIDVDHYTEIRISNRQSSQIEKKINRILRALGA